MQIKAAKAGMFLFDTPICLITRNSHLAAEATAFDPGVISDLYYADIYEEGGAFSSWDPNGDGVFAAWRQTRC